MWPGIDGQLIEMSGKLYGLWNDDDDYLLLKHFTIDLISIPYYLNKEIVLHLSVLFFVFSV